MNSVKMLFNKYFDYIFKLIVKKISAKRLILILSFIVGLLAGIAAIFLKNAVHYLSAFIFESQNVSKVNLLYFIIPLTGIFITVIFVRKFIKDDIGHGVTKVLYSMSKSNGYLKPHNMFSSLIGAIFTVGSGGSVGLEAPIVLTGSSIGSNLSRKFKLNYKYTLLLIGCGAAGAIAGIFKAPIAGVIFALEVLMLDLTLWSIIPLLISSATAATLASFLMGKDVLFNFTPDVNTYMQNLHWYLVLGIFTGLVSVYFTRGTIFIEENMKKITNPYHRLFFGSIILGCLIFIFPPLFGEGYNTLRLLLTDNSEKLLNSTFIYHLKDNFWIWLAFLLLILFFKVIAMTLTTSSGGVGGIFAPSLFSGGLSGFIVAKALNQLSFIQVSEKNFALAGMAGVMSGVMHSPLTAIFLIGEITGGYALFIPLIIVSATSFITVRLFVPYSIYTHRLAQRGELITHDKDKTTFLLMNIDELIETNFEILNPDSKLRDLVNAISRSSRNVFPVIDSDGKMVGILTLNDVRQIVFNHELYDKIYIRNLMYFPEVYVNYNDSLETIANKIESSGHYNVPVLQEGKYIGFVSRAKVFSAYRKFIKDFSEE